MTELNPFTDIDRRPLTQPTGKLAGTDYIDQLSSAQVGAGSNIFRVTKQGLWLGAAQWASAPFRVDMQGNLVASSASFPSLPPGITIFKQDGIPTSLAVGDLWFDSNDNNKVYRAGAVGADQITAGEWELVRDTDIAQALSDASTAAAAASDAQDTADVKGRIFAQNGIPTSISVGDLWFDTDDNNKPYRAASVGADAITAGEWELVNDLRAADALVKAGSTQPLTGSIQVGSSAGVLIDGANRRILINDGTYNVIHIGYQSGGY